MTPSLTSCPPFEVSYERPPTRNGLRVKTRETLPPCWALRSIPQFDYSPDSDRPDQSSLRSETATLWTPQPGPQTSAIRADADEILFGGEPGGGKTDLLLGIALSRHTRSHIFRRDAGQLGEMTDRLREIVGDVGRVTESPRPLWRHGDQRIEMAGIANEADAIKWQGRAGDLKAFDEVTQFSRTQYLTVSGWGRSTKAGQKVQTVATCNPPVDEDALWVVERWAPWLDPNHPHPAKSGEIRWFANIGGVDTECEDGEPFELDGETIHPSSRTFIRSHLADNAYLGDDYRRRIDALPEPMRTIFKTSDFMALLQTSHPLQVIPTAWVKAAQARWQPTVPEGVDGRPVRQSCVALDVAEGGRDRTVVARRHGDWFAPLEAVPGAQTAHAKDAAQLVERAMLDAGYAVVDADGVGAGAYGILYAKYGGRARSFRGVKPTEWRDKANSLDFFNCVTGDARIAPIGRALRIYRSRYDGPLYRVKMAGGDEFTVTANHNVLTPRGWVAIHALGVGDQLLDTGLGQRSEGRDPEEQYMPPPIGKVYRAARRCFGSERVADVTVNFHGDRPVGEVEVVTLDGLLWQPVPTLGQHPQHADFVRHLAGEGALASPSSAQLARHARYVYPWTIEPSAPVFGPQGAAFSPLRGGHSLAAQPVGVGIGSDRHSFLPEYPDNWTLAYIKRTREALDGFPSAIAALNGFSVELQGGQERLRRLFASWLNAAFAEDAPNNGPVSPESLAQRVHGLAGQIPTDEIIRIDILPNDHDGGSFVYTLQTTTGAYSSQSIAHRNCKAAAWWAAREALDPSSGRQIALPPGNDLLAELCAVRWEMSGQKIKMEKKDDTKSRLGRSPDLADAVVMALWPGAASELAASFDLSGMVAGGAA